MATIGLAVSSLDRLPQLVPVVQDLGRKHAGYGVRDDHYDAVGAALLWTLEQGLGPDFTPETRTAWTEVYGILAGVMKEAARQQACRFASRRRRSQARRAHPTHGRIKPPPPKSTLTATE